MSKTIKKLVADSPLPMAAINSDKVIISISRTWLEQIKFDAETVIRLADLFERSSCDLVDRSIADVFATNTFAKALPVTCVTSPGSHGLLTIWPVDIGEVEANDSTNRIALIVFSPDSELARTKEQYDHLQRTHELILNAAGEGVYGLDSEGRMTFANQASTEILGWSVEECLGKSAHQVHHHTHADGSTYEREDCPIYAAFKDGEVRRVDNEVFWHADGRAIPVEYTSTPMRKNGELNGAVVVFRGITDRLKVEKQREDAYQEVERLKEQLLLERDYLRDEIKINANFGEIIGHSPALKRVLEQVEAVAQTDANVLVFGESGVGKELIARAIHTHSPRVDRPLVKVNCASIPKELFESEFFGHVQGAFTSAYKDRVGRIQLADGGTLFLDEVGEIPLSLQSKLLRVLQEREFERVGDDKTISVNVRIVAATNRNLEEEIKAGRFREDLYYRLSVFPIQIPALRNRKDDILPLTQHLLETICRSMGKTQLGVTRQQGELLQSLAWPGNIRELRNVLERAIILSKGSRLRLDLALPGQVEPTIPPTLNEDAISGSEFLTDAEFQQKEKRNLVAALAHAGWRVSGEGGAAELLEIKASTLTYRMKALGIVKPKDLD
ncbi:MAG: PAS domain S-box-containing protein [Mariniblastus sp.]|jgi:PAS domain S-box-containing protein